VVVERTATPTERLRELIEEFGGNEIEGLEVRRPTLEDIYLELTGE
jgi:ABC-2 type transport system ATP-binding protein